MSLLVYVDGPQGQIARLDLTSLNLDQYRVSAVYTYWTVDAEGKIDRVYRLS